MVEMLGHQVVTADDETQALAMLHNARYDLALASTARTLFDDTSFATAVKGVRPEANVVLTSVCAPSCDLEDSSIDVHMNRPLTASQLGQAIDEPTKSQPNWLVKQSTV